MGDAEKKTEISSIFNAGGNTLKSQELSNFLGSRIEDILES